MENRMKQSLFLKEQAFCFYAITEKITEEGRNMILNKERENELLKNLLSCAEKTTDLEDGMGDLNSEIYINYSMQTDTGNAFYRSLTDELLLSVLRKKADELGHSPAQKEIFWVWREYIKAIFKRWPYALKAAGLSKDAGKGGKSLEQFEKEKEEYFQFLQMIQDKAAELCRIPHPKEMPQILAGLKKMGISWSDFVREAGLDRNFFRKRGVYTVQKLDAAEKEQLRLLLNLAWEIGRPPLKEEVPEAMLHKLMPKCGSYRNVLFQIGLEPVEKKRSFSMKAEKQREKGEKKHRRVLKECYYQVLSKDAQYYKDIKTIWEWKEKEGRLPARRNIAPEVRKRLQKICGSWENVLRQLEYIK